MIVRTAPVVLPQPDAMRAMERLESQLRRAADDLAAELAAMRAAVEAPLVAIPDPDTRPVCGKWMRNLQTFCARSPGHTPTCRSREAMDSAKERRVYVRGTGRRPRKDAA
jgi:hypothetical protein